MQTEVILIFDIGKTNKKLLLFDDRYNIVFEKNENFDEILDEDGYPCEDIKLLTKWIIDNIHLIKSKSEFLVKAINFSTYGASFVLLDNNLKIEAPLYNYLKPLDAELQQQFYNAYGGEKLIATETASPVLGNLNSGMQLYRLKYEKPSLFQSISNALHLPQYISFIITGELASDITSIGCHTNLWNFQTNQYHAWVATEGLDKILPPIANCKSIVEKYGLKIGYGLHDSSAALIPYLNAFTDPFVLISTGTWCISLNPFNQNQLTNDELENDCLCYLSYTGTAVKASRLFAGYEHEIQVKRLADFFQKDLDYFKKVEFNNSYFKSNQQSNYFTTNNESAMLSHSSFSERDLFTFSNYDDAYHQLIFDIVQQQIFSTNLVLKNTTVSTIYVDGGFSKNEIYMQLLANHYKNFTVNAVAVAQASAIGAAMAIHSHWTNAPIPTDVIKLKLYKPL